MQAKEDLSWNHFHCAIDVTTYISTIVLEQIQLSFLSGSS